MAALDLPSLLRFTELALAALGEAREEIDALNVYPVPDGDTGTNMYLTVESARSAMLEAVTAHDGADDRADDRAGDRADDGSDLEVALTAFARGALLGARGNSGVILSQLVGALGKHLLEARPGDRPAVVLAEGLAHATEASYAAVGDPVEGTILSVARAASDAAGRAAADERSGLGHVVRAAARGAREALAVTPHQLTALADAGVVDAGGRGLSVVLDAAEAAVTGHRAVTGRTPLGVRAIPVPAARRHTGPDAGPSTGPDAGPSTGPGAAPDGPAYEVDYLLDAEESAIPALRQALVPLGDSLVVVGGTGLWHVHVHVDDVGAAIEAGIAAGRPHRIEVTNFADQALRRHDTLREGRTVVAVAAGPGLAELFAQAGAVVVPGGPGRRPSTGDLVEAVTTSGATEVIVLPNDAASVATAEAAARTVRETGRVRVAVVPTVAQVQGLAAVAVHEPGRSFDDDIIAMTSAARHARSGAVTVAARRAMTTAGPCEPGDVLGAVEGDFVVVGQDLDAVSTEVLERLLGGGGELVTLVGAEAGDDASAGLAGRCASYLRREHPTVDVVVYDGGQQRYPLLVGVE